MQLASLNLDLLLPPNGIMLQLCRIIAS